MDAEVDVVIVGNESAATIVQSQIRVFQRTGAGLLTLQSDPITFSARELSLKPVATPLDLQVAGPRSADNGLAKGECGIGQAIAEIIIGRGGAHPDSVASHVMVIESTDIEVIGARCRDLQGELGITVDPEDNVVILGCQ